MVIEDGKNYFKTEEFSSFIGDKIYRAGCPIFSISAGRRFTKIEKWFNKLFLKEYSNYASKYEFLDTDLLRQAMIKLPAYVKVFLKLSAYIRNKINDFKKGEW